MAAVTAPNGKATATERVVHAPEIARESSWGTLYRLAGIAALAVIALVPIGALVYIVWPPPGRRPSPVRTFGSIPQPVPARP